MAVTLTDDNFAESALDTDKLVMVDFWAAWCGPCRALTPIVEKLSAEYEGKAVIGKLDVDNNPQVARKFGIRNLPTILFLKGGEIVDKQVGLVSQKNLEKIIDKHL